MLKDITRILTNIYTKYIASLIQHPEYPNLITKPSPSPIRFYAKTVSVRTLLGIPPNEKEKAHIALRINRRS